MIFCWETILGRYLPSARSLRPLCLESLPAAEQVLPGMTSDMVGRSHHCGAFHGAVKSVSFFSDSIFGETDLGDSR